MPPYTYPQNPAPHGKYYFTRLLFTPQVFHYNFGRIIMTIYTEFLSNCIISARTLEGMHMRLCREEGFTGLEAAIVLIAFVVVASVFSYAVLGAGFYTTSKTQEVIYSAVDSAGSTPQLLGNVYGIRSTSNPAKLDGVQFSVVLSSGGKYIDFSAIDVTWSTSSAVTSLSANDPLIVGNRNLVAAGKWGIVGIKPDTAGDDVFLEPNEIFTIYVNPDTSDEVSTSEKFNIEMKSPKSGAFAISRTCPDQFDAVTVLN